MKNAGIKIKRNIQNVNITNNNVAMGQFIFHAMLSAFVLLAVLYFLILGNMVFNIVQRKNLEKTALTLGSQVSNLELSYLSVSNSVDVALSSSMGFKAIPVNYATRKSLGYNVTDSLKTNNEI
jgi:hypothetical protein